MEKDFDTVLLFDIYASLLTEKQQRVCDMYYNQDYSLAEIAKIEQTTRQAVQDGLGKARQKLMDYEKKLGFRAKREKMLCVIEKEGAGSSVIEELKEKLLDIWEQ